MLFLRIALALADFGDRQEVMKGLVEQRHALVLIRTAGTRGRGKYISKIWNRCNSLPGVDCSLCLDAGSDLARYYSHFVRRRTRQHAVMEGARDDKVPRYHNDYVQRVRWRVGITLDFMACFKAVLQTPYTYFVIMEDDVDVDKDKMARLLRDRPTIASCWSPQPVDNARYGGNGFQCTMYNREMLVNFTEYIEAHYIQYPIDALLLNFVQAQDIVMLAHMAVEHAPKHNSTKAGLWDVQAEADEQRLLKQKGVDGVRALVGPSTWPPPRLG